MHKQNLKKLLAFHRDLTFDNFCRLVFPDFTDIESRGYLNGKFELFQNKFFIFLAELDEAHLEYLAEAIQKHCVSDDKTFNATVGPHAEQ